MLARAASNSGAVCESNARSKPRGARSRAIAPASADGGTNTMFGIHTSPVDGIVQRRDRTDYAPISTADANSASAQPIWHEQATKEGHASGDGARQGLMGGRRRWEG